MPIFSAGLNFLLAHKLRAPPPWGTDASPQNLPAPLPSPRGGSKDLAFRSVLARLPANPARRGEGEGRGLVLRALATASAPEFTVSRLSELLSRSGQRGLSVARFAQVQHSSPRESPPT